VVPSFRISDSSSLLMRRSRSHSGGGGLDLLSLVWLSTEKIVRPDLSLLDHLLVLDAVLVDGVVISAGQESTFFLEDFETPSLTVEVRNVDELLVGSISVNDLDSTVVMTYKDSAIQDIEGGSVVVDIERNLSHELVLSSLASEY